MSVKSLVVDARSRLLPQIGLFVLLLVELLYITVTFDTQSLDRIPAFWARLIGWTPEYLRLAITALVVALMVSGKDILTRLHDSERETVRFNSRAFGIHVIALVVFTGFTAIVMGRDFPIAAHQGLWAIGWAAAGAITFATWALSVFSLVTWCAIADASWHGMAWGLGAGAAAWTGGFLTQASWKPLARYTFSVVAWTLRRIYTDTTSDPSRFVLGTPRFAVNIAAACSGYEGIGLILAFLSIYFWLFRKELRFPRALVLLPLGAAAIWILNAMRIAALIVIGTSGWPQVALGGFHSQAGWLSFNAVGLGFVALSMRGRYFMAAASTAIKTRRETAPMPADLTTACLAPFLAILGMTMATGSISAGFDWLYPLRVVAAGAAIWACRKHYAALKWSGSWWSFAIGFVTFVVWLALMPAGTSRNGGWPAAMQSIPIHWAAAWMLLRVIGYVVTAPIAEELAFRGFLTRRIQRADFQNVPVGAFSWSSFVISSVLFGAFHGSLWLPGTIAGMAFGFALYRRRSLGEAVWAHATTNGLIALYACATGRWWVWS